jgi:hypothetical protein
MGEVSDSTPDKDRCVGTGLRPVPPFGSCKDCGSTTRKLVVLGPRTIRCVTCIRTRKKAVRATVADQRLERVYDLPPGGYDRLLAAQGGACGICGRPRRSKKRMPVDHDHTTSLLRGLLCFDCNAWIGRVRADADTGVRLMKYFANPPAWSVIYEMTPEEIQALVDSGQTVDERL